MRSNKVVAAAVGVLLVLAAGLISVLGSGDDDPKGSLAVSVDDPVGVDDATSGAGAATDAGDTDERGPPATDEASDEGAVDGEFEPGEGDLDGAYDADNEEGTVDAPFQDERPARYSSLPAISVFDLPSEAIDTLQLIEDGGPYPYRQDGSTFQNREGLLPDRELGHYQEFTVETPGSDDRGARRIVAGADGERYWTADHYASFEEIIFE